MLVNNTDDLFNQLLSDAGLVEFKHMCTNTKNNKKKSNQIFATEKSDFNQIIRFWRREATNG